MNKIILSLLLTILLIGSASAVAVTSIQADDFSPGKEGQVSINVENDFNADIKDVSASLMLLNLPFIPIGSSTESTDKIKEDDDEQFVFRLKAASKISPGDYEIPYTISYKQSDSAIQETTSGTLGIKVIADPILSYTVSTKSPVVGTQGTITLKIVNKGFSDAKFVSVKIVPTDFELLSSDEAYIGAINSDDFESANFDVAFTKTNPIFLAVVEYVNFENEDVVENVALPLTVYTPQRAQQLGIQSSSNLQFYFGIIIALILIYILFRLYRKRQRLKRTNNSKLNQ
jgi:hypothetical protein